jgi:hypothetical protein
MRLVACWFSGLSLFPTFFETLFFHSHGDHLTFLLLVTLGFVLPPSDFFSTHPLILFAIFFSLPYYDR